MPTLSIDDCTVTVPEGTTILLAAQQVGVAIPTLCHRPTLPSLPGCMVCAVCEESADNRVVPACATRVAEGMRIRTTAPAALALRRAMLQLLLSNHAADCEAPCQLACPCHFDIPRMLGHLAQGEADAALAVVLAELALPVTLGCICPAPCEKACRRGVLEAPVAICAAKRLAGTQGAATRPPVAESGRRVVVVGAGPLGLAAAFYLRGCGHTCHVVEATPQIGAALQARTEGRLPAAAQAVDVARLRAAGVTFTTGTPVSPDQVRHLLATHDALVLAAGADAAPLAEALGLAVSQGLVMADRNTHQTANPQVFTGGAAMQNCRLAVLACAHGRRLALQLDAWLRTGQTRPAQPARFRSRAGALTRAVLEGWRTGTDDARHLPPAGGVPAVALALADVRLEAARCLHCNCAKSDTCHLRELCTALGVTAPGLAGTHTSPTRVQIGAGVVLEAEKCVLCGICVRTAAQMAGAIGPAFHGRGFEMRIGPPLGRTWADVPPAVLAACVAACPTGCLAQRESKGGAACRS
jgi:ferredoxin